MSLKTFGPVDDNVRQQIDACQQAEDRAPAVLCADNHLGYCVPEDNTEILTRRGWLPSHLVQVGDWTIGYDRSICRTRWTRITSIYRGRHDTVRIGHSH